MKTTTFLRTLLAVTAMAGALTTISCTKKGDPKPEKKKTKLVNVVYKINSQVKDLKLKSLVITGYKGQDSTIAVKDTDKLPREIRLRRPAPAKNAALKIKTTVDKPGKVNLEILVDNKSVKKLEANITDIKKEGVLEHKF
ncbi:MULTISPECIES: hypothetical protein [Sphingobacterium]|uniref:hypothetical protein n=1 Tax=Sphingobacterium TaxID=28453 RepID=UPI0028A611BD|nr:hypothetical protein [Sphingobacterium mizutaii]